LEAKQALEDRKKIDQAKALLIEKDHLTEAEAYQLLQKTSRDQRRPMVEIATATRNSSLIDLGLSPRGTIALRRAAQAMATTEERDYVLPDDVKRVAVAVMAHRLKIKGAHYNGRTAQTTETVLEGILNSIPVPV
jgi:MoxR-like ATPase